MTIPNPIGLYFMVSSTESCLGEQDGQGIYQKLEEETYRIFVGNRRKEKIRKTKT
jgi:hypothetical protein